MGQSRKSPSNRGRVATPGAAIRLASPTRNERNGEGSSLFLEPDYDDVDSIGDSALELLERWDAKSRDEMLRSMDDFRPCPHCSGGGSSGRDSVCTGNARPSNQGGGFVTPDCLAPINEERERNSELLLSMAGNLSSMGIVLSYFVYYLYCTSRSAESDRSGAAVQVLSAVLPSILIPILPHALRLLLATAARREILQPIHVTCPNCLADFNLEASSELLSEAVAESASRRWKASNTRPCPGCASPIMKDGGCNHVKCGRCRVDFCWSCMRSRTRCKAYQCTNGAPFGNAFGDGTRFAVRGGLDALERERQAGQTLIERIDRVEAVARLNLSFLPFPYASIVLTIFVTILSNSSSAMMWNFISWVLFLGNSLFCPSLLFFASLLLVMSVFSYNTPRRRINNAWWRGLNETRHNAADIGGGGNYDGTLEFIPPLRRLEFMSEEELIVLAIARSIVER